MEHKNFSNKLSVPNLRYSIEETTLPKIQLKPILKNSGQGYRYSRMKKKRGLDSQNSVRVIQNLQRKSLAVDTTTSLISNRQPNTTKGSMRFNNNPNLREKYMNIEENNFMNPNSSLVHQNQKPFFQRRMPIVSQSMNLKPRLQNLQNYERNKSYGKDEKIVAEIMLRKMQKLTQYITLNWPISDRYTIISSIKQEQNFVHSYQEFLLEVNHQLSTDLAKFFTIQSLLNKDLEVALKNNFNTLFNFLTDIWVEPIYFKLIYDNSRAAINVLQITETMAKNSQMFQDEVRVQHMNNQNGSIIRGLKLLLYNKPGNNKSLLDQGLIIDILRYLENYTPNDWKNVHNTFEPVIIPASKQNIRIRRPKIKFEVFQD